MVNGPAMPVELYCKRKSRGPVLLDVSEKLTKIGVNPTVQGKLIRLILPELSEERRTEFVKLTKKMAEDGRVSIRHIRRDAMDSLKKEKADGKIPEDDEKHAEKELQKLTDTYIGKIEASLAQKEREIMTV